MFRERCQEEGEALCFQHVVSYHTLTQALIYLTVIKKHVNKEASIY